LKPALLLLSKDTPKYLLEELEALARVASYEVKCIVKLRRRGGSFHLTRAKLNEILEKIRELNIEAIICAVPLPPSSFIRLQKETGKHVIDRTLLLLEVFDKNAGTKEAKLQIETAMFKHWLPILKESINILKRGELPGFMGGGAYAVDRYYLHVRRKIARNTRELEKIGRKRQMSRTRRRELGLPLIAITGFANAGKTTLFNVLTGSSKPTGDIPFTTLSTKVSKCAFRLENGSSLEMLFIDTVGLIVNVPAEIIEAFYSTLEEIVAADVIVFVLDASEEESIVKLKIREAKSTFANIGALNNPVIVALNKIDLIEEPGRVVEAVSSELRKSFPNLIGVVPISAKMKVGIESLVQRIWESLNQKLTSYELAIDLKETRGSQLT